MSSRTVPGVIVDAGGQRLDTAALVSLRVRQQLSLPTLCELVFSDPPGPLRPARELAPGTPLHLTVQGHVDALFAGEVTAVELVYGPAMERWVRVRAYDRLHRLQKRHPVRALVEMATADLARELVADLGLGIETEDAGPLWPFLIQHGQSDWALLVDVAESSGLFPWVHESTLQLLTLEGRGAPLALALGTGLLEARLELNEAPACRSVEATGWNPLRAESYAEARSDAASGRQAAAEVPASALSGEGRCVVLDLVAQGERQVEARAGAELARRVAHEVTLWGIAEGDPRLNPGARVTLTGVDEAYEGTYVLAAATHTLDAERGYMTELSTAPPTPQPLGGGAGHAVATLGVVTRVDDPDQRGRVCVALPTFADVETTWMHVLSAAAGANKGLVALPDVGDRVLVLFPRDALGEGVVLGGLYGMDGPYDSGVEANAVRRYTLRTPGGQHVVLDDAGDLVRVEDSRGSFVELAPEKLRVHAEVDLEIEAPGRSVVIRGQAIDFERG